MRKFRLRLTAIACCLLSASLLVSCRGTNTPEPTPVPPTPTPEPPLVTLTVWDQFQRDAENALINDLNSRFEEAHPGVQINRIVKSFDSLRATVDEGLKNPEGPDVIQLNQGSDMRAEVEQGLLLGLTKYVPQYKWDRRFSDGILARNRFTADGRQFGVGDLYGVSPTAEVVGVFFNKEKFEQMGLEVPNTLAEFEAILSAAKLAGEVPLVLGNAERWPGIHIFSALEHVLLPDRTWLDNFVYGRESASFDIPENVEAAALVQQWVDAGYFNEDYADLGYEDAWKMFAGGNGLMMLTGSWLSADIVNMGGENFGFFLVPPVDEGDNALAIGGAGVPFTIRRGSQHADLAADYLDWMVSLFAGERWLETGVLPGVPVHESKIPVGTLLGDIVSAYGTISAGDQVGHYIDWSGPTMYEVMGTLVAKLMAKEISPEQFVAEIQAEYAMKP